MDFKQHSYAKNKDTAKRAAKRLRKEGWLTGKTPHSGGGFKLFIKPIQEVKKVA